MTRTTSLPDTTAAPPRRSLTRGLGLTSVAGVVVAVAALQLVLAGVSIELLSTVRAYVAGESLYSKGQKDALLQLQSYLHTHDDAHFLRFLEALQVPEGDAKARRALQQAPPDRAAAREGFLQGQNRPDDVDGLIHLFLLAQHTPFMARAIGIWTEGDETIAELRRQAERARGHIRRGEVDAPAVRSLIGNAPAANRRLTDLQRAFSDELGHTSGLVRSALLGLNLLFAVLIGSLGAGYIRRAWCVQRETEAEMTELVSGVGDGVLTVDAEGRIVLFNRAAQQIFGCAAAAARGAPIVRFLPAGLPVGAGALLAGEAEAVHEIEARRADGRAAHLEASFAPLHTGSGLHTTIVCRDVTERREARERERREIAQHQLELARKAYTDPLTGLPNREALEHHLDQAISRAQLGGEAVSVLFLDLDGFKTVNDSHGHLAGDELLRQAAGRLRQGMRRHDEVYRVGGDEFVVLVTESAGPAAAAELAGRLLAAIRLPYRLGDAVLRVTASAGAASYPQDGTDARSLLMAADAAMYRAKQAGKDGFHAGAGGATTAAAPR